MDRLGEDFADGTVCGKLYFFLYAYTAMRNGHSAIGTAFLAAVSWVRDDVDIGHLCLSDADLVFFFFYRA